MTGLDSVCVCQCAKSMVNFTDQKLLYESSGFHVSGWVLGSPRRFVDHLGQEPQCECAVTSQRLHEKHQHLHREFAEAHGPHGPSMPIFVIVDVQAGLPIPLPDTDLNIHLRSASPEHSCRSSRRERPTCPGSLLRTSSSARRQGWE